MKYGSYDLQMFREVRREIEQSRGIIFDFDCRVNVMWPVKEVPALDAFDPDAMKNLAAESYLDISTTWDGEETRAFHIYFEHGKGDEIRVAIEADTCKIRGEFVPELLHALELILVKLAATEMDVASLIEIARVRSGASEQLTS